mgnify:CR=1 FL=1
MSTPLKKKLETQLSSVRDERAALNVGKQGLTEAVIAAIDQELKRKELIKVKFLQNFFTEDFDADISRLTKAVKASLVEKRGKTIILYRSLPKKV